MKDGFIKVAAATPEIKVADPAFNKQAIIQKIEEAEQKRAEEAAHTDERNANEDSEELES